MLYYSSPSEFLLTLAALNAGQRVEQQSALNNFNLLLIILIILLVIIEALARCLFRRIAVVRANRCSATLCLGVLQREKEILSTRQ